MIEPRLIRQDMQNGLTIADACTKYNISFGELVEVMKRFTAIQKKEFPELYIYPTSYGYRLQKNNVYYGSYEKLEDAMKVRDYFIYNRWSKKRLDKVCEKLGVVRWRR